MSKSSVTEFFDKVLRENPFAVFVRSPYNYDVKAASSAAALHCPEETLAQQQFKDESDPNTIMKRFASTGDPSLLQVKSPQYGDFSGVSDYHSAVNAVIEAEAGFMELNADLRARFNNDPGQLLDFLADGKNRDEAIKLGLLDSPQDLSTHSPKRASDSAGEGEGVGKSTPPLKASKKGSSEPAKGESGDE